MHFNGPTRLQKKHWQFAIISMIQKVNNENNENMHLNDSIMFKLELDIMKPLKNFTKNSTL